MTKVIETYKIDSKGLDVEVNIVEKEDEFVRVYDLNIPEFGTGTKALLHELKKKIIIDTQISAEKILDTKFVENLKEEFSKKAEEHINKELPDTPEKTKNAIITVLIHEMLGLGRLEFLMLDHNLEEIVINASTEPVWVYHKKHGWLRTNIIVSPESEIQNYASIIARRVGKQITTLSPLLDAHLVTGDRANATLFPISNKGNTITIRKFRRDPWTVSDLIENKTTNSDVMALIWLAMEYELNIVVSGGTASGKTSFLNVCLPFISPNHRILTIEDTREIQLPGFLHWIPLTTREPNPEGKGGVTMLDLLVNSLRMRPDRIIVGEVRRQQEAEVMFEAMHTGHSVYTTVHANTSADTIRRLTNPPINTPVNLLEAVHLNVVMFRNRRLGKRRVLEISEYLTERSAAGKKETMKPNILYRWKASTDSIAKYSDSIKLYDELMMHTGFNINELESELNTKKEIIDWMGKYKINKIEDVGRIMAQYYMDGDSIGELAAKQKKPSWLKN